MARVFIIQRGRVTKKLTVFVGQRDPITKRWTICFGQNISGNEQFAYFVYQNESFRS